MRPQAIDVKLSPGRILSTAIFRSGGKKLLGKGHVVSNDDVKILEAEGMETIWVAELEDGEITEDVAVCTVSNEMGCGSYEIRLVPGGRANLVATENCCVLVDDELLKQINCTSSIAIATRPNFSYAAAGERLATVKSTPFAVAAAQLEAVSAILRERGPILQARPVRSPGVAVLYTDPANGERARQFYEGVMRQRLGRFGSQVLFALAVKEEEMAVARGLHHLLQSKPRVVLIASTTAPAGPDDVIGQAMLRAGATVERFLAPVEPGNLFLLSYKDDVPIVAAPGCFRSTKQNVVDLILAPLLARYRVTGWEVAGLGHGGLLC
jgi:molybdenum cofactor cytidylyltransferase